MPRVSFKTATSSFPKQGNRELPVVLDFTATGTIFDNLSQEMSIGQIDMVQSVFIDNSDNAATLILTFLDTLHRIEAQPNSQGIYPVITQGQVNYKAVTSQGQKVTIIFSNVEKKYTTWGPTPGVTVVPPLINPNVDLEPIVSPAQLVAGVANQTVKFYRGMLTVGAATKLTFTDGNGGAALFTANLFAGGGITFQPSGIPWFNTSVGNGLFLASTNGVNVFGGFGYTQG